jgi:F0F1-type ATP synthase assembly protein I
MSRQDSIEEYLKLYRIWIFAGFGTFVVFILPIFLKEYGSAYHWFSVVMGLIGLIGGIYSFWKFHDRVQELNQLTNSHYNSFLYIFIDIEPAIWLMLAGYISILIWEF